MQSSDGTDPRVGLRPRSMRLPHMAVLALAALAGSASAQQDALRIVTRTVHAAGTPEWRQIREWLLQHPETINGKRLGDPDQLSAVSLDYSAGKPAATRTVPRPVPLPATGTPGDSIAIASCAQGYLQSWKYGVDDSPQHRWSLQSYSLTLSAACADGAGAG